MKKYLILSLLLVLIAGFAVAGGSKEKADDGKLTIAFVPKTMASPYWIRMSEGIDAKAKELGVNITTQAANAETEVEKQVQIVENLIIKKVDAILLAPSGSKELVSAVKKANEANIPVIIVDSGLDDNSVKAQGAYYESFVGSDNYEGGMNAGKFMIELFKDQKGEVPVAVLEGIAGHESGDMRKAGFNDAIKGSNIKVISSQTAQWERTKGFDVFQNMLTANPGIKGLFACNDEMALGAVEAIAQAGKTGEIAVIGFDANSDALQAVKDGKMAGTVAQFPGEMGAMSLEVALKVLSGEKVEKRIKAPLRVKSKENI